MLNFLFPRFCHGCIRVLLRQEELLCLHCISELPLTHFHKHQEEFVLNIFYGLLPVYQATSLLYFAKKGITQNLLHRLKYKDQQNIGEFFGEWLGSELKQIESYREIEAVVIVPLHKKRLRKRGYNQVRLFAKQIAQQLEIPFYENMLIKKYNIRTQVGLERWARIKPKQSFQLADPQTTQAIENKHVLLVDDLITTGATIVACGKELLKAPIRKLSIASLAVG